MPLTNLSKYIIEDHLGSGTFGDVYKAIDKTLNRVVALKVLKPRLLADEEAFDRFIQEAQVGAGLFHANIATVLDLGEADGYYFLAMRFVDGKALDKVLSEEGPFSWERTCAVIREIGAALDFAHAKGLVHRDIKPQNIITGSEGAVLTDFGLVRALANSGMTTTGALLGSPSYMAPEIWEGLDASFASDQYAFACVIYEMLTGQILFDGKTPPVVMAKHFKEVDLGQGLPDNLPEHIQTSLKIALSKNPADRFAGISYFKEALLQPGSGTGKDVPLPVPAGKEKELPVPGLSRVMGDNPAGIDWVEIPAGEFLYGDDRLKRYLPEYSIARYPLTNAQYKLFLDENSSYPIPYHWNKKLRSYPKGNADHPVVNVSYHDAQAFCEWAGCRLPTEEEWEKAARGTDGRKYPWGNNWGNGKFCNSWESGIRNTTQVSKYPLGVSPYGVWDMLGNVWEWTSTQEGNDRILRGGSWNGYEWRLRVSYRIGGTPVRSDSRLGFRCVTP